MRPVETTALFVWLRSQRPEYAFKALELRDAAEAWLTHIPHTFPHYTRHTIDHSDEIIQQISNILFSQSRPDGLVLPALSPTEAYIAIASAYLHDAGMVVSDKERETILASQEWSQWLQDHSPHQETLAQADRLRSVADPLNAALGNFLADVQTRFVMAEYIRGVHHMRSADLIRAFEPQFARFAFNDIRLTAVIAAVCGGHGLTHCDLEDRFRFPEETDLRGDKVNVRFCTILLRLGDLLDLRTDRACPLLLNAACPLPAESIAHWGQYACIRNVNVAPDRIDIDALCTTPTEHRVIRDWCRWIEDEVHHARKQMVASRRHRDWSPPLAQVGQRGARETTMVIEPAPTAQYVDIDWRFELDEATIFERLIRDVYSSPWDFVRELLQNSVDAVRCRLSRDLRAQGMPIPEDLTSVPEDVRSRYSITVSREAHVFHNQHTGTDEQQCVICVDDPGMGMTRETIRKYLLQVGRSFYQSLEFRRNHTFVPTSRFGVGFLSVFGISDHVLIETWNPESGDGPLALVLTGPRNYLLAERGTRRVPGTRVAVRVGHLPPSGSLFDYVRKCCRRVEFPIRVQEGGLTAEVRAESPADFVAERVDPLDPSTSYKIRVFPFAQAGVRGELYVLATTRAGGERWDTSTYLAEHVSRRTPAGDVPVPPAQLICYNGITVSDPPHAFSQEQHYRVDCRSPSLVPTLARGQFRRFTGGLDNGDPVGAVVSSSWERVLGDHLRDVTSSMSPEDGWRYKQRLANRFQLNGLWETECGMIPLRQSGELEAQAYRQALQCPEIWFIARRAWRTHDECFDWGTVRDLDCPCLLSDDAERMCERHQQILGARHVAAIRELGSWLAVKLALEGETSLPVRLDGGRLIVGCHAYPLPPPDAGKFAIWCPALRRHFGWVVINSSHPLGAWCASVWRRAWSDSDAPLGPRTAERLWLMVADLFSYEVKDAPHALNTFLDEWNQLGNLPVDLIPPNARLTATSATR